MGGKGRACGCAGCQGLCMRAHARPGAGGARPGEARVGSACVRVWVLVRGWWVCVGTLPHGTRSLVLDDARSWSGAGAWCTRCVTPGAWFRVSAGSLGCACGRTPVFALVGEVRVGSHACGCVGARVVGACRYDAARHPRPGAEDDTRSWSRAGAWCTRCGGPGGLVQGLGGVFWV